MSSVQNHIIRRQVLEVNLEDEAEHWQWQERLSRFAREEFAPQLAALLDRLSVPGEVIRIEKLEVAAGLTAGENWEKLLLGDLLRKVEEALPTPAPPQPGPWRPEDGVSRIPASENLLGLFFFFLKNGVLPWQAAANLRQDFEQVIFELLEKKAGKISDHEVTQFIELLKSGQVRQRLAGQFSSSFLLKLAAVFFEKKSFQIAENQELVLKIAHESKVPAVLLNAVFWQVIFEEAAGITLASQFPGSSGERLVLRQVLLRFLDENPQHIGQFLLSDTAEKHAWPTPIRKLLETLKPAPEHLKIFASWLESEPGRLQKLTELAEKKAGSMRVALAGVSPKNFKKWLDQKIESPAQPLPAQISVSDKFEPPVPPGETGGLYVDNAGLVLLHPFLPAFFEELNVVKNGRMVKQQRAVHLLQYLATGHAATPEFELPLNKLLCGLPLNEPVTVGIHLTKKEKTEAKNLLEAVIRHWNILKNTSPEGLQGAYLCRTGKLSRQRNEDWQLQVEGKGFDVLLADLPWSISMIKLPWMEGMLWVEWQ